MNRSEKHMDSITGNDAGLAEVVGFILLLAVVVIVLSLYMTYVIPVEGRDNEIHHMNSVQNRFIDYKITIDSLWNNDQKGVKVSTSLNLGTGDRDIAAKGIFSPILRPVTSGGQIAVNSRAEKIHVNWTNGTAPDEIPEFTMGDMEYRSGNNYWIGQNYYYQMGGVLLNQDGGTTVKTYPSLIISNNSLDTESVNFSFTAIQLYGNQIIRGSGPVRIDTRLKEDPVIVLHRSRQDNITVTVAATDENTAEMWTHLFHDCISNNVPDNWYRIALIKSENKAVLDVWGGENGVMVDLNHVRYAVTSGNVYDNN